MKYKPGDIKSSSGNKVIIPDFLHFIWIGDSNRTPANYMHIWKQANPDKRIFFWYDPGVHYAITSIMQ